MYRAPEGNGSVRSGRGTKRKRRMGKGEELWMKGAWLEENKRDEKEEEEGVKGRCYG